MNTDTGELIAFEKLINSLSPQEAEALGFTPVPKEHEAEAKQIIEEAEGKHQRAFADMSSNTPLVKWAKSQQHKTRNKNKKNMAKASRRRNRK